MIYLSLPQYNYHQRFVTFSKSNFIEYLHICKHSVHRLTRSHPTQPLPNMRKFSLVVFGLVEYHGDNLLPGDKRQVRKGMLVSHQRRAIAGIVTTMLLFLLSEISIQDTRDAVDFTNVALESTGQFLLVELPEPRSLSEIRAMACRLELEPLFRKI